MEAKAIVTAELQARRRQLRRVQRSRDEAGVGRWTVDRHSQGTVEARWTVDARAQHDVRRSTSWRGAVSSGRRARRHSAATVESRRGRSGVIAIATWGSSRTLLTAAYSGRTARPDGRQESSDRKIPSGNPAMVGAGQQFGRFRAGRLAVDTCFAFQAAARRPRSATMLRKTNMPSSPVCSASPRPALLFPSTSIRRVIAACASPCWGRLLAAATPPQH